MDSEQSILGNEMEKSNSIVEYCIQSDDSDNVISKLRADNFNLRLRCYNMSIAIDKCKCSKNNNNKSINTSIVKMDTFLDNQKQLKSENLILREENEMLKYQINELKDSSNKLSEINSLKLKCEQLTSLLNDNIPGNEILQDIIKRNDELLKLNIQSKQDLSRLQMKNYNLKKKFLEMNNLPMVSTESKMFHAALQKEFNESFETSKHNIEGCSQCNTLKVNYEKIAEILTQFYDEFEHLTVELKSKDSVITDLENKLENMNTQPIVDNSKLIKYKQLTKDALASIVKKDQENIHIKKESKETIDFYISEMGKLNRKLACLQKHQDRPPIQTREISTLLSIIDEIFKHLSIKNEFDPKLMDKSDSSVSEARRNWISVLKSVDLIRKHLMSNNISRNKSTEVGIDIERNISQSPNTDAAQEDAGNVSMQFIMNKFNEVKELSDSFRDLSFHLNSSTAESNASHSDGRYSPQFRLGHISNFTPHQNESVSIYFDKESLNQTAYRSFDSETFNQDSLKTLMQKIDELGNVIHRYSEIVSDIKRREEMLKVNNSPLVGIGKSADNSVSDDTVKILEAPQSHDLSVLKALYHEETEKFMIEIKAKEEIIKNLVEELSTFKEKIEEYEKCNLDIEQLQSKLMEYEKNIVHLNSITEQRDISNNRIIKELQFELSESNCKLQSLETEAKTQLVNSQQEIKHLSSRNESLCRKIKKLSEDLSYSIKETQSIENGLKISENEKSTLFEKIKELERNVNNLSEEKEKLDRLLIEKEKTLEDSLESLSNMSKSLMLVIDNSETVSININNIFNAMLARKLIVSPLECNKEPAKDTIEILRLIEEHIIQSTSENKKIQTTLTDSLISSEKSCCEVLIDRSSKLPPAYQSVAGSVCSSGTKSQCSSLNDLTNITSFNTGTSESEGNVETIRNTEIDMTGFKVSSIRDVVRNPEKVVIMLQKFAKDNGDLKRRLKGRYEENKRLIQIIKSNNCISKVCETVEKLTEECAINNENVEKVKNT